MRRVPKSGNEDVARETRPAEFRVTGEPPVCPDPAGMRTNVPTHGRHIVSTLATTVSLQGISFISGALIARMLGVEKRGVLAAVILWPSLISYVGALGGPTAYAYLASVRTDWIPRLIRNAWIITIVQSILLAIVGVPLIMLVLRDRDQVRLLSILYLLPFLPLNLLSRYLNAINQGTRHFSRFNIVRLGIQGSYTACIVALYMLGFNKVGWIVVALIASAVMAVILAAWTVAGSVDSQARFDLGLIRDTFRYGIRSHMGSLAPIDSMQLDLMLVVVLLSASDAGLYAIAASIALVIRMQGSAIGMVALPSVAAAPTVEDGHAVASGIFRMALLLNVASCAIIVAGCGFLVPLVYGHAYDPAIPLVRLLALGVVAASLRQVLGDCLRGAGQPIVASYAEGASWVAAVAGLLVFVPLLGVIGAALGVSLSYATALGVMVWLAHREGLGFWELFRPRWSDVTLAVSIGKSMWPVRWQPIRRSAR